VTYREPDRCLALEAELAAAHRTIADLRIENEILKSRIQGGSGRAARRAPGLSLAISVGAGAGLGLAGGLAMWWFSDFEGILVVGPILGLLGGGFVWAIGAIPPNYEKPGPPMTLPPG